MPRVWARNHMTRRFCPSTRYDGLMSTLRPEELDERLENGESPFLLDIRPRAAYREGAIEDSYNLPVYDELGSGNDEALCARLEEIPQDRTVVVICKMGVVARRATSLLQEEGYDAVTLSGGMRSWRGYKNGSFEYKLRTAVSNLAESVLGS